LDFAAGYLRTVDDSLGITDTAAQAAIYLRTIDDLLGLTDLIPPEVTRGAMSGRHRPVSTTTGRTLATATMSGG
jgi:hypothetical protein